MTLTDIRPAGWTECTIDDLVAHDGIFRDGDWVESKDQDPNGDVRLIQLADIGDGFFLDKSARFLTKSKAIDLNCTFLEQGDLLVARMPDPLGRCCIFPLSGNEKYVTVVDVCVIRLGSSPVVPKYLTYLINSPSVRESISALQSGSTRKRISRKNLSTILISLAPINEQKRIVAKIEELFSELDKGIESLKTAREQLKVYRQAVLKHAFEGKLTAQWRNKNKNELEPPRQIPDHIRKERDAYDQRQLADWHAALKDWEENKRKGKKPGKPSRHKMLPPIGSDEVASLPKVPTEWNWLRLSSLAHIESGMSVSKDRRIEDPVEVPYLRVANVQRGALILNEVKTMLVEKSSLRELCLEKWDVLFNEGGDRDKLGRGWIWEEQISPCITQNHVFRASPYIKEHFHSKFISYWGNTFGQDYFDRGGKQTTNLASINKTVLSMFPVPMPSLAEQKIIIDTLEDSMSIIDAFERDIEDGLIKSEALRQSILKKAFSGQLVPQDPNDEPASVLLERIRAEKAAQAKTGKLKAKRQPRRKRTEPA